MRSKNIWIALTLVIVWVVVVITSLQSPELMFGDEPVSVRVAALANWFWGILATVFVMRSTLFRRPNEMGWGQSDSYPWITVVAGLVWIVAMLASLNAPNVVISEDIIIPVGAIVAPPIAVALTLYICEFLITGFAARKPMDAA